MIVLLASALIGVSAPDRLSVPGHITLIQTQNVCCVLKTGQLCCAPNLDSNGRPSGCGC